LQDAETLARELAAHGILDLSENPIISANPLENPSAGDSR